MQGNLHSFCPLLLSSAEFFLSLLSKNNYYRNTIRESNSLYQDQAQHFVDPYLGPNCLQKVNYCKFEKV